MQDYIENENARLEREQQFWAKEIVVKIEYKFCPNLTIIDTPGRPCNLCHVCETAPAIMLCQHINSCHASAVSGQKMQSKQEVHSVQLQDHFLSRAGAEKVQFKFRLYRPFVCHSKRLTQSRTGLRFLGVLGMASAPGLTVTEKFAPDLIGYICMLCTPMPGAVICTAHAV